MTDDPSQLHLALVEAYPAYVVRVLRQRGVVVDDVLADAIVEGTGVLNSLLTTLDRTPFELQQSSPLELFREALRPISHALDVAGADEVQGQRPTSLAWDKYGLAPGSSQVLSAAAHEAHMRWALEKAAALGPMVTGPSIQLVVNDRDRVVLEAAVAELGYRVVGVGEPTAVIIDADLDGSRDAIADYADFGNRPSRIIAYGRSVDDLSTMALKALGADLVVEADKLFTNTREFLPALT